MQKKGKNMSHIVEHFMVGDLSSESIFKRRSIWASQFCREHCLRFPMRWIFWFIMRLVEEKWGWWIRQTHYWGRRWVYKGKCNYWLTGGCSSSMMISYHCVMTAQVEAMISFDHLVGRWFWFHCSSSYMAYKCVRWKWRLTEFSNDNKEPTSRLGGEFISLKLCLWKYKCRRLYGIFVHSKYVYSFFLKWKNVNVLWKNADKFSLKSQN